MMPQPSIFKAALWMAGWLSLMLVTAVAGRETTRELDVFQVMLMRSVIGFFMLYPLVRISGGLAAMKTARPLGHIGRNVVHYTGQYLWLYALTLIPLAQLIAIEFTMPIWTAILAVIFLGERMNVWKNASIVLGLIGVAIIVRPGAGEINPGQLYALAAAVGFAISVVMVKSLTRTESVVKIIFWMLIVQSVIGLIPAIPVWQWPSAQVWPWIFVIAFGGTFSHYCMARAMLYADATVVVPMDFLRVPLTALTGWLIYSERVDTVTVVGAALILAGNMLNLKSAGTARIRPASNPTSIDRTSN
ncbi:EamA family transporter [Phyllobacterium phragmitis]|uniref:EamA family transporter n=1 Tax=Phyllobacterium phragmitis TaxID=2670329 RepID=A0A2S9ISB6_9HYPH|nr:DMT family transporter [Phyllobacterium phragmitis]PRD43421.1 EamA family transporter [Phyllobacterium phragmitis]